MTISIEDIEKIAEQSQLILSEEEKIKATQDLTNMLENVDKLSELEIDDVEPTIQVLSIVDVFREDEICPSMDREIVLKNASSVTEDSFIVPKVVE